MTVDRTVAGVLVCADLNANANCDAGEPASVRTGTDGRFSIVSQPANAAAETALRAAPLLAQIVPGTVGIDASVDAAAPAAALTTTRYTLAAPGGRSDTSINPLTTLVQAGVKEGLSVALAEAAVVRQMAIPANTLYDYQSDPASAGRLPNTPRGVAIAVAELLSRGVVPTLSAANAEIAASDQLTLLNYTDTANFSYRLSRTSAQTAVDGRYGISDIYVGRTAGVATSADVLSSRAVLTTSGWTLCDSATTVTLGTPNRSSSCSGTSISIGATIGSEDVAGQRMSDVVARLRAAEGANTALTLDPAVFGAATFPAGSIVRSRTNANLLQTPFISSTALDAVNVRGTPAATLEALVAGLSTASVNGTAGHTSLGLVDDTHALRVAFTDATTAQFYRCDYVALPVATISNCAPYGTSGYTIATTNGVRLLSLASFPATTLSATRGFTEYAGKVYPYRTARPEKAFSVSTSSRLNPTAWNAIKAALQIP